MGINKPTNPEGGNGILPYAIGTAMFLLAMGSCCTLRIAGCMAEKERQEMKKEADKKLPEGLEKK